MASRYESRRHGSRVAERSLEGKWLLWVALAAMNAWHASAFSTAFKGGVLFQSSQFSRQLRTYTRAGHDQAGPQLRHTSRRALALSACEDGNADSFLLSFDGVMCDSARESSRIAFNVACEQWPEEMGKTTKINPREAGVRKSWVEYDWSEYEKQRDEDIPRWLEEKMRQLRPVTSSSSEMVLAARLCVSEALAARRSTRGQRPLTVGEIVENWDEMRDMLYVRYGVTADALEAKFRAHSAEWRQMDKRHWLELSPLNQELVRAARETDATVMVMSTRPRRFTRGVMDAAGLPIPDDHILQVTAGDTGHAVTELLTTLPDKRLHIVTDQLDELKAMAGDLRLVTAGNVQLHFATWGYNTPSQRAAVACWPRVRSTTLDDLTVMLNGG
mmetsp:Transcript_1994/g.4148  ORF Transcript_1994/g.4148 Transcript_1994/m.4148 type:complete len:387 (+) Transcript_1994:171-1331(+)